MLKCSLHIRICNIFYLILQLTKQNLYMFTFQTMSFYTDLQHYLASLDTNFEKFSFRQPTKRITMVSIELFKLERSTHGNFLLIILEHYISVSPQPPISSALPRHFLNRKNCTILTSDGRTSHWTEHNDGCVQRCGIHSLLLVIFII